MSGKQSFAVGSCTKPDCIWGAGPPAAARTSSSHRSPASRPREPCTAHGGARQRTAWRRAACWPVQPGPTAAAHCQLDGSGAVHACCEPSCSPVLHSSQSAFADNSQLLTSLGQTPTSTKPLWLLLCTSCTTQLVVASAKQGPVEAGQGAQGAAAAGQQPPRIPTPPPFGGQLSLVSSSHWVPAAPLPGLDALLMHPRSELACPAHSLQLLLSEAGSRMA